MNCMIKKALLLTALIVTLFFAQTARVFAQNSYELFWPIVAGRTQGDSLYPLKLLKEKLRGVLIFSDIKKAEYFLFLSEKRLVEFENLIKEKKDMTNAGKTLEELKINHSKVVDFFKKAEDRGVTVADNGQRIKKSFGNQVLVLKGLEAVLAGDLKNSVLGVISSLKAF